MRVLVLGGTGAVGSRAVTGALGLPFVECVTVGARDKGAWREDWANDRRVLYRAVDITIDRSLADAVANHDVVLNAVGPFYRYGHRVLQAAIAAGADYLDVCDDWELVDPMLGCGGDAVAAGTRAVFGMGLAPGTDSMLAARAMEELDHVHDILTGWHLPDEAIYPGARAHPTPPEEIPVTLDHLVHCVSVPISFLEHGARVLEPPLRRCEVAYPRSPAAAVWTVGSPEALTLHRGRETVRRNVNVLHASEWLVERLQRLGREIRAGTMDEREAARRLLADEPEPGEPRGSLPSLFAIVRGTSDDVATVVGVAMESHLAGGLGGAGTALLPGLELLHEGAIEPGVWPLEQVVSPIGYFDRLAKRCDPPVADGEAIYSLAIAPPLATA